MERNNSTQIVGLGAPMVDLVLPVSQTMLEALQGALDGSDAASENEIKEIIEQSGLQPTQAPGGSTSNVLRALASLGMRCAQIGMVGRDEPGRWLTTVLREAGVEPIFSECDRPTSQVLCLVAPSGKRTMRFCLGASQELKPSHIVEENFTSGQHLHLETYAYLAPGTVERAALLAQEEEFSISLDLSSFEMVRRFKPQIEELLENYVDIVFGNEDEVRALMGLGPEEGCDALAQICEVAVVMMGDKGAWIRKGQSKSHVPAEVVKQVVDTTGAGDLFAAGFLYGYLNEWPLRLAGQMACRLGAVVIQQVGTHVPSARLVTILQQFANLVVD